MRKISDEKIEQIAEDIHGDGISLRKIGVGKGLWVFSKRTELYHPGDISYSILSEDPDIKQTEYLRSEQEGFDQVIDSLSDEIIWPEEPIKHRVAVNSSSIYYGAPGFYHRGISSSIPGIGSQLFHLDPRVKRKLIEGGEDFPYANADGYPLQDVASIALLAAWKIKMGLRIKKLHFWTSENSTVNHSYELSGSQSERLASWFLSQTMQKIAENQPTISTPFLMELAYDPETVIPVADENDPGLQFLTECIDNSDYIPRETEMEIPFEITDPEKLQQYILHAQHHAVHETRILSMSMIDKLIARIEK